MNYKSQKEFLNVLKNGALHNHVGLITWASFYLRKDGWVTIDFNALVPMFSNMYHLKHDRKVHPSFAWGIYQLMSNLDAQQTR